MFCHLMQYPFHQDQGISGKTYVICLIEELLGFHNGKGLDWGLDSRTVQWGQWGVSLESIRLD